MAYDAILLISFGGPEGPDDVIPFLENVLRGRNVPRERMMEVAEHYYHFGGKSPINDQCRALIDALKAELDLPIYWGNRNWHPYLKDTVKQMKEDGVTHALAVATSAFGSYSGCRQYREDIAASGAEFPIDKLPPYWRNSGFIEAMKDRVGEADAEVVFTAHSIPNSMAATAPYEAQLKEAAGLIHAGSLAYQSRSGPPTQPWLEPDICDYIRKTDAKKLMVVPLGFLSDHMEVMYDLDLEAAELARERGIEFIRAGTVGTHPRFVKGLAALIHDVREKGFTPCRQDCCQPAARPPASRPPASPQS